jgi:hypothetical protein
MLKRPARRHVDSSGTAPSAPGEVDARSDPSSAALSPAHSRNSRSRERSPLRNISTKNVSLEGELSAAAAPSPHTSGNSHAAMLTHASQAEASNASGLASSRRSEVESPQRSILDSGGLLSHAQSAHMVPAPQVIPPPPPSAGLVMGAAPGHPPVAPPYVAQPPAPPHVLYTSEAPEMVDMVAIPPPVTNPAPGMSWQQEPEPQDPFLDDSPLIELFGESTSALPMEHTIAPSASFVGARENGQSSITLHLPSFHGNSKGRGLAPTHEQLHHSATSISFQQAAASSGLGSYHSEAATSGLVPVVPHVIERRQSDPFLAEPAALDEEGLERGPSWEGSAPLPDPVDVNGSSAQLSSLDGGMSSTALLGRGRPRLQRVSEASEVPEGMLQGLGSIAAGASRSSLLSRENSREKLRQPRLRARSHDSEHSDPFLQETQTEE